LVSSNQSVVNTAATIVQNSLEAFFSQPNFSEKMQIPFGDNFDREKSFTLAQDIVNENSEILQDITILPDNVLKYANGAFSLATESIYLSNNFVTRNVQDPNAIANVLLEEVGHFIDSKINAVDAPGDEGEIFAAISQGAIISAPVLEAIKNEDDRTFINLNNQVVSIEQSSVPSPENKLMQTIANNDDKFFDGYETINNNGWKEVLDTRNNDFGTQRPNWWDVPYLASLSSSEAAHQALLVGTLAGQDDAAELLAHYLDENNGGSNYNIDLDEAIRESPTYRSKLSEMFVNSAIPKVIDAKRLGYEKGVIGNDWITPSRGDWGLNTQNELNWQLAVGGHHARYVASFELIPNSNIVSFKVQYFLKDVYDFDGYQLEPVLGSQKLHLAGYARAFEVDGASNIYEWEFDLSSGAKVKDGFGDDLA
jgi:hypothetical protein